jgi:hypothetical protein
MTSPLPQTLPQPEPSAYAPKPLVNPNLNRLTNLDIANILNPILPKGYGYNPNTSDVVSPKYPRGQDQGIDPGYLQNLIQSALPSGYLYDNSSVISPKFPPVISPTFPPESPMDSGIASLTPNNPPVAPPTMQDASGFSTGWANPNSNSFTPQQIQAYINSMGGDTASIANAMNQYGVDPNQVGNAIGMQPSQVAAMYSAVDPTGRYSNQTLDNPRWQDLMPSMNAPSKISSMNTNYYPPQTGGYDPQAQVMTQPTAQVAGGDLGILPAFQTAGGMRRGGKVRRFDDGGDTSGEALNGDLGLGGLDLSSLGSMGGGSGTPDFSALNGDPGLGGLDLSSLGNGVNLSNFSSPDFQSQLDDLLKSSTSGVAPDNTQQTQDDILNNILGSIPSDQQVQDQQLNDILSSIPTDQKVQDMLSGQDKTPPSDQELNDLMNQAYGTAATGGKETLNLNQIMNPPDQSDAETARLAAANTAAGNSNIASQTTNATSSNNSNTTNAKDPLTGLTAAETKAQQDRVNAFGAGLTNNGVQDFGTGAITPSNVSSFQDTLKNTMDNKGGFTSGFQTVGDNKIIVHEDGTATGINTTSGQTFTLPASTVDTMTTAGVLNSSSSGYNTATGGTNIAPGGGTTVTNKDGSKTTTFSDGSKVTQATDGTYTTTGGKGTIANPSGTLTQTSSTNPASTTKTTTPATTAAPAAKDNSMSNMLALLALMSLMDKGGGGGQGFQIPLFNAQRGVIPGQVNYTKAAGGGMMGGGISSLSGHLGGYSDGGRLLRGPGDGVSDDIPATIGGKEPARLAVGEFVVPARIVSELGNGSTEAGARKLYAMMDRIQKDRSRAKDIAADTKADKHLPA